MAKRVLLTLGFLSWWASVSCTTYYDGPVSDHFDGAHFYNKQPHRKGFFSVMEFLFGGPSEDWPEEIPVTRQRKILPRFNEGIRVTFISHATVLIQVDNVNILTDPVFSDVVGPFNLLGPRRVRQPAVALDDLPDIDVVLMSHDHYDHLDAATVAALQNHNKSAPPPVYLAGLGVGERLQAMSASHVRELDWHQGVRLGDLSIWFEEAQHRSGRGMFDHKKTLWGSFVVATSQGMIYYAGDTGYSDHFQRIRRTYGAPRLALLPIGAYAPKWFMQDVHINPQEALQAYEDLGSRHGLGVHYGTFKLSYEGVQEPRQKLEKLIQEKDLHQVQVPDFGQVLVYGKQSPVVAKEPAFGLDDPKRYLAPTGLMDSDAQTIKDLAANIVAGIPDARGQAVAIHDYVRDQIRFGWEKKFHGYRASEVLEDKRGFCLTKTTLFVALLRAAGIPARPIYVDINGEVLEGLGTPSGWLDHSYTEVYLEQHWVATDAYIVPLAEVAVLKARLAREDKAWGYGVTKDGTAVWDGKTAAFIQYIPNPAVRRRVHALYRDAQEFYRYQVESNNRGPASRLLFPLVYRKLNQAYQQALLPSTDPI